MSERQFWITVLKEHSLTRRYICDSSNTFQDRWDSVAGKLVIQQLRNVFVKNCRIEGWYLGSNNLLFSAEDKSNHERAMLCRRFIQWCIRHANKLVKQWSAENSSTQ